MQLNRAYIPNIDEHSTLHARLEELLEAYQE